MRTKIKVNGKYYRPVPWLAGIVPDASECYGCAFVDASGCVNTEENDSPCYDGGEFGGHILIRCSKEATAAYIAKRLGS